MKLDYDNTRTAMNRMIDGAEKVEQKSPLDLFSEFYELQNNAPRKTRTPPESWNFDCFMIVDLLQMLYLSQK